MKEDIESLISDVRRISPEIVKSFKEIKEAYSSLDKLLKESDNYNKQPMLYRRMIRIGLEASASRLRNIYSRSESLYAYDRAQKESGYIYSSYEDWRESEESKKKAAERKSRIDKTFFEDMRRAVHGEVYNRIMDLRSRYGGDTAKAREMYEAESAHTEAERKRRIDKTFLEDYRRAIHGDTYNRLKSLRERYGVKEFGRDNKARKIFEAELKYRKENTNELRANTLSFNKLKNQFLAFTGIGMALNTIRGINEFIVGNIEGYQRRQQTQNIADLIYGRNYRTAFEGLEKAGASGMAGKDFMNVIASEMMWLRGTSVGVGTERYKTLGMAGLSNVAALPANATKEQFISAASKDIRGMTDFQRSILPSTVGWSADFISFLRDYNIPLKDRPIDAIRSGMYEAGTQEMEREGTFLRWLWKLFGGITSSDMAVREKYGLPAEEALAQAIVSRVTSTTQSVPQAPNVNITVSIDSVEAAGASPQEVAEGFSANLVPILSEELARSIQNISTTEYSR